MKMVDLNRKIYPVDGDGALTIAEIRSGEATEASARVASAPTYEEATTKELQAGTVTEVRLISPKLLANEIDRRIAAALAK